MEEDCSMREDDQGHRPSKMTNKREILSPYQDQLEAEIKDTFLWAIGQNSIGQNFISEMTKTVKQKVLSSLPLYKLYTHYCVAFLT